MAAPDPYAVLGLCPDATDAEITAAYRRLVRAHHPDGPHPDRDRLAAVLAAYHALHDRGRSQPPDERPAGATRIPVRVHRRVDRQAPEPELRAGPVRRHPPHA